MKVTKDKNPPFSRYEKRKRSHYTLHLDGMELLKLYVIVANIGGEPLGELKQAISDFYNAVRAEDEDIDVDAEAIGPIYAGKTEVLFLSSMELKQRIK